MFRHVLILAVLSKAVFAAETSLAVEGFPNVSLSGSVQGTGDAGTTYILQGVDTIGTVLDPFTMTLVEDSSELLETVVLPSASLVAFAACTISGPSAECEEIAEDGTALTTTIIETIAISGIENPVSIIGGNATGSSSSSKGSSNSSSVASSTASGSGSATQSLLPPSFSPTAPPATGGSTPPPGPAPTVSANGSTGSRNFESAGWLASLAIAALCAFFGAL